MALSIKDEETDALVRRLARARNLSYTGAIRLAVSNELARSEDAKDAQNERKIAAVRELQARWRAFPPLDLKAIDQEMYDEDGLPR